MAELKFKSGDWDGAEGFLKRVIGVRENFYQEQVQRAIGEIYEVRKQYEKALEEFKKLY